MREYLENIIAGRSLTFDQAVEVMNSIISGKVSAARLGGLLTALKVKGETADEIAGMASAMNDRSLRVELDDNSIIDISGTGGDGKGTFNISTASSIVAAAAGAKVAKSGNRAVLSLCGSANLLDAFGIKIDGGPKTVKTTMDKLGITFMFSPLFHSILRKIDTPRFQLGIPTIFDLLGPLTNPAGITRLAMGVKHPGLIDIIAGALDRLGYKHALIFCSEDGMDELSLSAMNHVLELKDGGKNKFTISAEDVGLNPAPISELAGGDPDINAVIVSDILNGREGAYLDTALFNAGAGIYLAGLADDITGGVTVARQTIESGKAKEKLEDWRRYSREISKK